MRFPYSPRLSWLLALLVVLQGCASPEEKGEVALQAFRAAVEAKDFEALAEVADPNQLRRVLACGTCNGWKNYEGAARIAPEIVRNPIRKVGDEHVILYIGWYTGKFFGGTTLRCLGSVAVGEAYLLSRATSTASPAPYVENRLDTRYPENRKEWRVVVGSTEKPTSPIISEACVRAEDPVIGKLQDRFQGYSDGRILQAYLYNDVKERGAIEWDLELHNLRRFNIGRALGI